ncbi:FAD-dependent pyridine nucleotide-disulfide oxidoreductase [Thermoanaerobacter ethanolicus JW 200]|nr:FAD-dependent pyridine nucleotide-disulfide oxidoreductase [Thermoanaerobacter ethanolicus JW 200]
MSSLKKAGIELDPITGGPIVNEMLETSVPGIFACGNVLQVHDLVDNVTAEARLAANSAIRFIREGEFGKSNIAVKAGNGIRYVVPQR